MMYAPNRTDFDQTMIPMFSPAPFIPVRGEGSTRYDQQGKQYIDFAGDIAVNTLSYANPLLKAALNITTHDIDCGLDRLQQALEAYTHKE